MSKDEVIFANVVESEIVALNRSIVNNTTNVNKNTSIKQKNINTQREKELIVGLKNLKSLKIKQITQAQFNKKIKNPNSGYNYTWKDFPKLKPDKNRRLLHFTYSYNDKSNEPDELGEFIKLIHKFAVYPLFLYNVKKVYFVLIPYKLNKFNKTLKKIFFT
jgi:hypothetical protein